MSTVRWLSQLGLDDIAAVGAKNAILGEMRTELAVLGVKVPNGFATTADAYRRYLAANQLEAPIAEILDALDPADPAALATGAARIRAMIERAAVPAYLEREILDAYRKLSVAAGEVAVAVRSSPVAAAADLPPISGTRPSFLMVHGGPAVLDALRRAYAGLFTARSIRHSAALGIDHMEAALSVGVQRMVRSDLACSGGVITRDPVSGFRDMLVINAIWGFGDGQERRHNADVYRVFKPALARGMRPIVGRRIGSKDRTLRYDELEQRVVGEITAADRRSRPALSDDDVLALARAAATVEAHFVEVQDRDVALDIDWAQDGASGELFILRAAPEVAAAATPEALFVHNRRGTGPTLTTGIAVGSQIASGRAVRLAEPEADGLGAGDVLITVATDPSWELVMRRAGAIVTEAGGGGSHASVVARDLGIPAVVGTRDATSRIDGGEVVTVSCAEGTTGRVYAGELPYDAIAVSADDLPPHRTKVMLTVGDAERALRLQQLPVDGVGLARMESILAADIRVHPMALAHHRALPSRVRRRVDAITDGYPDKVEFFVSRLAEGIGTIAAAFYPRPVWLRLSDFTTAEFATLTGGSLFEPREGNPLLGRRGVSRYLHSDYREAFALEMAAIARVRDGFGLGNLHLLVPFCRTPAEAGRVLDVLAAGGLEKGAAGLQVRLLAELPANIFEADAFADLFDGFAIGAADLTRLAFGLEGETPQPAVTGCEPNGAVRRAIAMLIATARERERPVAFCGCAPADPADFAAFLVGLGIDSISLSADALVATLPRIVEIEESEPSAVV